QPPYFSIVLKKCNYNSISRIHYADLHFFLCAKFDVNHLLYFVWFQKEFMEFYVASGELMFVDIVANKFGNVLAVLKYLWYHDCSQTWIETWLAVADLVER